MLKFGLCLDNFLYDLFIELLWFVLELVSKFWCLRGCWSPHLLGLKGDCVLVVHGGPVVLPEFPSEIPQRLWFWQSPSVSVSMELFGAARTCVHLPYWRVGTLKMSVGLKAIERNGWKPYRYLWCGCHSDSSYLLFLGVTFQKYTEFSFFLYCSWIFFFPHFCFCTGINALLKCISYKRGLVEYIKLYNEQK